MKYPPLITVDWLTEHLKDENLIILDASTQKNMSGLVPKFTEIKLPGAIYFDIKGVFSQVIDGIPNMLPEKDDFERECQRIGINNHSRIVVYDSIGVYASPRVRWMFKAMGFDHVAVLDGGLTAWKEAGCRVESLGKENQKPVGDFNAIYRKEWVRNRKDLEGNVLMPKENIIDARSAGRFSGTAPEPRVGLRSGNIPHSCSLPWREVVSDGHFKSIEELKNIFEDLDIDEQSTIFTCGSGMTACIIMLAYELVYDFPVSVYDGSWTEWGREVDA